ncbi:phosphatidylglycerophosphatase A [Thermosulfidibacter takaii ABI70S6]|uniref:Phosphatidylglycerophosphatase A n=1 Tax=Thermosulfidibacter takaii (strain DSM 17441 / JCM 13301 / NBRC 103674 / ABI70S6) TaxID=1298851 RepID=A0A0S3QUH4_THET7|nr:phosphatidylglycerophosphatase A [Thermosulfidibacter takaii]BAT71981.1 phosphatidylglycerophosphatase A [Thermosulfidibacter takaii ABI70S6]
MRTAKVLFLTGLGSGLSPAAPGTFGTLIGLLIYLLVLRHFSAVAFWFFYLLVFWLAVKYSSESEALFGENDSSKIVIDEILGIWIALWGVKLCFWSVIDAFLLFRFFDIYKVSFIKRFDELEEGWGVVLDDVAAGVIVNLLLRVMF